MARAYRKKPVVVEAVQWTGENHAEMCEFIDPEVFEIKPKEGLIIHTLEGDHHASPGDYIIKGVNGEFYPCKPDIFAKTYEPATLTQPNEPLVTGFDVVDTKTGKYPELEKIALKEDWAKHLMYCDMEGFAIEEDGTLLLLDECGRQACCPAGRFEIRHLQEGDAECLSTSCL